MPIEPEMTSTDLVDLLRLLSEASIDVWLDGGWGVDALLKKQTRPHKDVDIIVRVTDMPELQEILGRKEKCNVRVIRMNSILFGDTKVKAGRYLNESN